jgi:hypothetical protein
MIKDIRQRLQTGPFRPFYVVTSSGRRYRVASADHASINPRGNRVLVWFDDGSGLTISGLHIVALEEEKPQRAKAA